ncbi:hypothetical protein SLEP1_g1042 [Rubroshorea leprosula]|uniref:STAS domain-containing protein n=1 Tax=Rubroshorea leprosula TaxID=152421 RepID=A0AAV5HNE8_9ROSI|nr:hypothetical protein SLEP1_g1042 [Rubroshorea leprosula]
MATAVMITLLFLTPLFDYSPLVVLSSIIIAAMLGLIDYEAAIHLWKVDKFDFIVWMGAYVGVVFGSVEIGLVIAVGISLLRVLLISRWIDEEEDKLKSSGETSLQYIILDMGAVGNINTSGISMLEEVKKTTDRRGLKLVIANLGAEVMKKLNKSNFIENIGQEWVHLTVVEAVAACIFMLHSHKHNPAKDESEPWSNV